MLWLYRLRGFKPDSPVHNGRTALLGAAISDIVQYKVHRVYQM